MDEQKIRQFIQEELQRAINKTIFKENIQIMNNRHIQLGRTTGTKIGTATDQKIAFYGVTPVDQPATVADPSGGGVQDAESRIAIIAIIDRLQELGLIST